MYELHDYVVSHTEGVLRILSCDSAVYRVQPCNPDASETTITPEEIIRKIISREKAEEVVDRTAYMRTLSAPNNKLRKAVYTAAFEEYEPLAWVQTIKTVYIRTSEQRANADDMHFGALAKKYLHEELSTALAIPYDSVEAYIKRHIEEDF